MANCAVVRLSDGLVVNTIVAEATDIPPQNTQLIEIADGVMCIIGYIWNGFDFIDPNAVAKGNDGN